MLEQAAALLGDDAQIQGISFGIEDRDALITRARAEAFANAKRAADELAQLAGAQLGEVISIEEQFVPSPTPVQAAPQPTATPRPAPASAESAGAGGAEQIAPGQIAVRVTLVVRFALERPPPM